MAKLLPCLFIAIGTLVACSSDNKGTPADAKAVDTVLVSVDAPSGIDAPVSLDAPSSSLACFGATPPTTAPATVTVAGATTTFSQTGTMMPVTSVVLETYKSGVVAPLNSVTSSATDGTYTTGPLTTGGVPLDGYAKTTKATYRTTYLYPPFPVAKSLTMVPVPMLSTTLFAIASAALGVTQDDANNGVLFVTVADCTLTPLGGATLSVKQGGTDVGVVKDIGTLLPAAAGIYLVFNVPDGATTISATYNSMTFPPHVVLSHKQPPGGTSVGTITASVVTPGPI